MRTHRSLKVLTSAGVLSGAVAVSVLAAPPVSASPSPAQAAVAAGSTVRLPAGGTVTGPTPQTYDPVDLKAGDPCAFPIHETFPVNEVVGYTYADRTGRTVAGYYTGRLIARVTRVDTGATITVDLSGDAVETYAADGSSVIYGKGPFASIQHAGDHPGPEFAVLDGVSVLAIAADHTKTIRYSSKVTDLCRTLA